MTPRDAFEPGPGETFPAWPRRPDGTPDPERMPTGKHRQRTPRGDVVIVDVTPRHPLDHPTKPGEAIVPPPLP